MDPDTIIAPPPSKVRNNYEFSVSVGGGGGVGGGEGWGGS